MEIIPLLQSPREGKMHDTPIMTPNVAGIYNAFLDGKNSSIADKEAAIEVQKAMPDVLRVAEENRSFLRRCIRYMLGHGIKQFIDIGSGYITTDNIHELAQLVEPTAKIVYVDQNPSVVEEGSKLLATNGTAIIICADIRKPNDVFKHPNLIGLIDFAEPVGILMMCVACFLTDAELTHIMSSIQSTICDDSYVAMTHDTLDGHPTERENIAHVQKIYNKASVPLIFRNRKEVLRIFQGLCLVEPGVVFLHNWRIELDLPAPAAVEWLYGGLAKKTSLPVVPGASPQMYVNLMQLRKCLNTTALTSTSLFFIIWCFITYMAQSFLDVGVVSFQQLKDMALE
ncbi:hypothetical protein, variant [Verruconis gallopava]|uniref:Histidine-specific methyltransferase SAM-dependent domain-containing protein n=1 Tax=Verruconis gallopava TaxID=253628 RepID=A0A0D1YCA4_9PEZI|nr:uncharacterized protein PV09_09830 [Verruconis gallopava]XP_016208197.1 hypothetical protein, variant [Verruconis gallopava]KIV98326.1 hypothetical protein PV09_09830 [Verruconis gallopava]KIV98327.1 hypothetical protein, variant [Verruconis gallopava]